MPKTSFFSVNCCSFFLSLSLYWYSCSICSYTDTCPHTPTQPSVHEQTYNYTQSKSRPFSRSLNSSVRRGRRPPSVAPRVREVPEIYLNRARPQDRPRRGWTRAGCLEPTSGSHRASGSCAIVVVMVACANISVLLYQKLTWCYSEIFCIKHSHDVVQRHSSSSTIVTQTLHFSTISFIFIWSHASNLTQNSLIWLKLL
jgi:hypothetical protein